MFRGKDLSEWEVRGRASRVGISKSGQVYLGAVHELPLHVLRGIFSS